MTLLDNLKQQASMTRTIKVDGLDVETILYIYTEQALVQFIKVYCEEIESDG